MNADENKLLPPVVAEAVDGKLDLEGISDAGVKVVIPNYPGITPGDQVVVYWQGQSGESTAHHDVADDEVVIPVTFEIPLSAIEAAGDDGRVVVSYEIRDRVGNVSRRSGDVRLDVQPGESEE
ncbi:hypothetical protein [Burkholderia sp. BCC1630]|uniref:hypothetical protein n=1 Tax=Burkholderia sp. BCC1630 TaxID=2676304 RepID=UPI00158B715F|nr:hypothetical protein [Burkholderia sp. BCC1630]